MPGYSRALEPFSKFNCFMDTLTHNRNHQSLNEVVDLGAVGRTDGLELRMQHVVQLEPNVLSVEAHLCKFPGGLHLAHAGPVVALEVRAGSAQGWVWIGDVDVLAEIGSSSRKIANVVAGNDGLHGLSDLRSWVLGLCSGDLHIQKYVGEVQLHLGWDAARNPVLNPLHTSILLKVQEGGDFGRPTEMGNKF